MASFFQGDNRKFCEKKEGAASGFSAYCGMKKM